MNNKVTADDMAKSLEILKDIKSRCSEVNNHVSDILISVEEGDVQTVKGISFLEVKNHLLLSYLTNLSHLMCDKVNGKSIKGHPSAHRLIEIRTVLEKMRPVDQKLKYQIDKLVKTATTGIGEDDPLKFKPNIDGLVSKLDDDDQDSQEEKKDGDGSSLTKYRPPKLAAMHYDEDQSAKGQQSKQMERAKKRALSSSIMCDLRDQYSEAPEEIRDDYDYHRVKVDKFSKERQEYEEKYFLRMQVSKKDLHAARKMRTMSALNEMTHFGEMGGLVSKADGDGPSAKKRKTSSKGKGKGKKCSKKWRKMRQ